MSSQFESFKAGAGREVYSKYEAVLETIKSCRHRLRSTVALVNSQQTHIDVLRKSLAACIDDFSTEPTEPGVENEKSQTQSNRGDGGGTHSQRQQGSQGSQGQQQVEIEAELVAAKGSYKSAYKELKLVKAQLAEAETLKGRALAVVMKAFQDAKEELAESIPAS
jgi:hypothetical protein